MDRRRAYFTNSLTPPSGLGLLASPRQETPRSGSVWLGLQKDGLPSCRGDETYQWFKAIDSRLEGQPGRCPFLIGARLDAETRDLALIAALSLFCAGFAWILGYVILGSVFFALGVVAALGIAQKYWR